MAFASSHMDILSAHFLDSTRSEGLSLSIPNPLRAQAVSFELRGIHAPCPDPCLPALVWQWQAFPHTNELKPNNFHFDSFI
jgi:hypothetical protein